MVKGDPAFQETTECMILRESEESISVAMEVEIQYMFHGGRIGGVEESMFHIRCESLTVLAAEDEEETRQESLFI